MSERFVYGLGVAVVAVIVLSMCGLDYEGGDNEQA